MSSVIVIPAWRRPEMLAICLKLVVAAKRDYDNIYHFALDDEYDPKNLQVITQSGFPITNFQDFGKKVGTGNSYNVLVGLANGLQIAENSGAEIIHLLEEDVWIAKDYFDVHERIHKQFNPWAVSLCRNQHQNYEPTQDPALVYKTRDYQSIGVSFSLNAIREILVHNCEQYFTNQAGYIRMMFPDSRFGSLFTEQDGLIARIIEKNKYDVFYANVPRAFHAGFYSYHRTGKEPEGTLNEKIEQLENMTEQEMNERSVYKDIRFCNLEGYDVEEFYFE